ncbi:MAG: radical SAM protein [Polyangiaceae bacterium]
MTSAPTTSDAPRALRVITRDDSQVERLIGPLLSAKPQASGWQLLSWDAEQGICLVFARGSRCVLIELEAHNPDLDCYARTRLFNVCARVQFSSDPDLAEGDRRLVDAVVRFLRQRETGVSPDSTLAPDRAQVREIRVSRMLIPEGNNRYYLNPYSGCMVGCSYCYVADRAEFSRRLTGAPPPRWGKWVDIKVNAVEVLRQEVRNNPPGVVRMSPILTEPYQPIERRYRVSRSCIEVLQEHGFRPVILTRESRILEDVELLRQSGAAVGFSIPTDDDRLRKVFEPGADTIENRFKALEACASAGLVTCVVAQPVLPMNVENFVKRVAPFVQVARIDTLHLGEGVAHLFREAGVEPALTESYQRGIAEELRTRFRDAGVEIDDRDDLTSRLERLMGLGGGRDI